MSNSPVPFLLRRLGGTVALVLSPLLACDSVSSPASSLVASIEVSPSEVTMLAGETRGVTARTLDAAGAPLRSQRVVWSIRDPAIASVSPAGVVVAIAQGTTQLSVSAGGVSTLVPVDVRRRPTALVRVAPPVSVVEVGQQVTLRATASDDAGGVVSGLPTAWRSSNPLVATVSADGVLTGVAPGSVTVTATIDGVSNVAAVTVRPVPVASVTIDPATATLRLGETQQLTAVALDARGDTLTDRVVTWTSSDARVATVTSSGAVRGTGLGTATITASSEGKSGTATVTVSLLGLGRVSR